MLTPHDIEVKEFGRAVRGYKTEDVDNFLDEIILDFQQLLDENKRLRETVAELDADLRQYKKSESSMLNTLESAKKLMGDISLSAEKRAEVIINNANANAEAIQREAKESISKLTEEGERLAVRVKKFKDRYKELLRDELSQIDGSTEDLIAELEREFLTGRDTAQTRVAAAEPAVNANDKSRDTIVVKEKTLEEMLMEDFGSKEGDLTRTIVMK
ncbi:MAG: DivIVA domain-containing protein [Emergencia sp.]